MILDCLVLFAFAGIVSIERVRGHMLIASCVYLGALVIIVIFWRIEHSIGFISEYFSGVLALWTSASIFGFLAGDLAVRFTKNEET